jgi:hypothetical protein
LAFKTIVTTVGTPPSLAEDTENVQIGRPTPLTPILTTLARPENAVDTEPIEVILQVGPVPGTMPSAPTVGTAVALGGPLLVGRAVDPGLLVVGVVALLPVLPAVREAVVDPAVGLDDPDGGAVDDPTVVGAVVGEAVFLCPPPQALRASSAATTTATRQATSLLTGAPSVCR